MAVPESSVSSRRDEELRIASNWMRRLQLCLTREEEIPFIRAMRHAGISEEDFQFESRVNLNQFDVAMRNIRRDVPDVTVRLYGSAELLDLSLIGYAIASSGTIGSAQQIAQRYHNLTSDRFTEVLEIEGGMAVLRPVPFLPYLADLKDIVEDSFTGNCVILRIVGEGVIDLDEIELNFPYEEPAYVETYRRILPGHHHFGCEQAEIRFPANWLDLQVATANAAMADVCADMCERILGGSEREADMSERVRRLLVSRPRRQMLRLEEAAEHLRLTTTQLRKGLYRLDTNYKKIVLEVRMSLAWNYLEATNLTVQHIAYLLDYSQPGPFSRAFKLHYGISPIECRNRATEKMGEIGSM